MLLRIRARARIEHDISDMVTSSALTRGECGSGPPLCQHVVHVDSCTRMPSFMARGHDTRMQDKRRKDMTSFNIKMREIVRLRLDPGNQECISVEQVDSTRRCTHKRVKIF